MRILGIDPGIAIVGFGLVDKTGHKLKAVQYGSIQTEAGRDPGRRLEDIYDALLQIISQYKPDVMAVEKLYFNKNVTTALTVGQARGVLMLAGVKSGLDIFEYTPLQIKQAIVGYGRAEKKQMQEMIRILLGLPAPPKPDDAADALAAAVCHAHSGTLLQKIDEVGKR